MKKQQHSDGISFELTSNLCDFFPAMVKMRRSNSLSELSYEDYKFADDIAPREKAEELERKQHENSCR